MYASMASIYSNAQGPRSDFGDSPQLNNWNLDSGTMCHMKPYILDFITGSFLKTDKYIETAVANFVTGQ